MRRCSSMRWISILVTATCAGTSPRPTPEGERFRHRGAALFEACSSAVALEEARGLFRVVPSEPDKRVPGRILLADDRSSPTELVFLTCEENVLCDQAVDHRFRDRTEADQACSTQHTLLSSQLGAPGLDLIHASVWVRLRLWLRSGWSPQILRPAIWKRGDLRVVLDCPARADGSGIWHVNVSQGSVRPLIPLQEEGGDLWIVPDRSCPSDREPQGLARERSDLDDEESGRRCSSRSRAAPVWRWSAF
jgi:hypothetical protein